MCKTLPRSFPQKTGHETSCAATTLIIYQPHDGCLLIKRGFALEILIKACSRNPAASAGRPVTNDPRWNGWNFHLVSIQIQQANMLCNEQRQAMTIKF